MWRVPDDNGTVGVDGAAWTARARGRARGGRSRADRRRPLRRRRPRSRRPGRSGGASPARPRGYSRSGAGSDVRPPRKTVQRVPDARKHRSLAAVQAAGKAPLVRAQKGRGGFRRRVRPVNCTDRSATSQSVNPAVLSNVRSTSVPQTSRAASSSANTPARAVVSSVPSMSQNRIAVTSARRGRRDPPAMPSASSPCARSTSSLLPQRGTHRRRLRGRHARGEHCVALATDAEWLSITTTGASPATSAARRRRRRPARAALRARRRCPAHRAVRRSPGLGDHHRAGSHEAAPSPGAQTVPRPGTAPLRAARSPAPRGRRRGAGRPVRGLADGPVDRQPHLRFAVGLAGASPARRQAPDVAHRLMRMSGPAGTRPTSEPT